MSVETLNVIHCKDHFDAQSKLPSFVAALTKVIVNGFEALNKGIERQRTRHHLAQLDERMLKDIGLDPSVVAQELDKPFWR